MKANRVFTINIHSFVCVWVCVLSLFTMTDNCLYCLIDLLSESHAHSPYHQQKRKQRIVFSTEPIDLYRRYSTIFDDFFRMQIEVLFLFRGQHLKTAYETIDSLNCTQAC